MASEGETARRATSRPALLAWVVLVALSAVPYLRWSLMPPPGRAFLGFFFWIEDVHYALSFVQQAEGGAFLFRNKLVLEDHAPALLNLEWWAVGRLSAALGGSPLLAYRILAILAALAFFLALDAWLRRLGLPDTHRFPALVLVATGGGLGGLRYLLFGPPAWRSLDLVSCLFPFLGLLASPHAVLGLALLLLTLLVLESSRGIADDAKGVALGTALGLVRPYDLVMAVAVRAAAVTLAERPALWPRKLAPLAGSAPVAAYLYWVFYRVKAFAVLPDVTYEPPPLQDFAVALGPAVLLTAVAGRGLRAAAREARGPLAHLLAWAAIALLLVALPPVRFALQFQAGVGVPLLVLAAAGLRRRGPGALAALALAMSSTALVALSITMRPEPRWLVPAERRAVALALRQTCRAGERVAAPPDIGLYVNALAPCAAYYPLGGYFPERLDELLSFYGQGAPEERLRFLDRRCITQLVLPGEAGEDPQQWLGAGSGFRRTAWIGRGPTAITLYARRGGGPCGPPSP